MLDINYLSLAAPMHRLTEPAIRFALSALEIAPGSLGLDAACGNGDHSIWLAEAVSPGGLIAILFWSSQRLLPGHPFLEARLNATRAACYPFQEDWGTRAHILSAPLWLCEAGLKESGGAVGWRSEAIRTAVPARVA
jgi:hypothetical protein